MIEWIIENLATIVIFTIVLAVITAIIVKLVLDKRQGKSNCGCGCKNCESRNICHKDENKQKM